MKLIPFSTLTLIFTLILALDHPAMAFTRKKAMSTGVALLPQEPSYCEPSRFMQLETQIQAPGTSRLHAFKLGQTLVIGMGVGGSEPRAVKDLAEKHGKTNENAGFCTWYFHQNSIEASDEFKWRPLRNPKELSPERAAREFTQALGDEFSTTHVSFLSCIENHHYLALGCHQMKHRGPSAFAMFLAYTGCQPKNALAIANYYWGLNGVAANARLAIAEAGYALGEKETEARKRIQTLLLRDLDTE